MPELVLLVEGKEYSGWTNIQIVRSLDTLADTFDLGLVSRGSSEPPPHELAEGDACEILYDGETLISGWIDVIDEGYTASSSTLVLNGRSRAGDLVDCSAVHKPWRKTPLLKIAQDLCKPFKIDVSSDLSDLPTEAHFKLSEGETVFAALDRLARGHGMRVVSRPDGSILFTRTGLLRLPNVAIEHGINVVSGGFRRSAEERFSPYIFKAQFAANDEVNGFAASAKYEVLDEGVVRYRPLVVERDSQGRTSTGQFTSEKVTHDLREAAEWERNTRAGKARQLSYQVVNPNDPSRNWENAEGLWEPNTIVTVRDPYYQLDSEFLVVEVRFTIDNNGTTTSLLLTATEAYEPKKPPRKRKKKGYSW
jgi:prophage tail gpP-like protein